MPALPSGTGTVVADEVSTGLPSTTTADAQASAIVPVLEGIGTAQPGVEAPAAVGGLSPTPEATVPVLEGSGTVAGPAVGSESTGSEPPLATAPVLTDADSAPAIAAQAAEAEKLPGASGAKGTDAGTAGDQPKQQTAPASAPVAEAPAPVAPSGVGGLATQAPAPQAPALPTAVQAAHGTSGPFLAAQILKVQTLIDLATRNGSASARIELHPEELGKVEVRLRSAAGGGLTASMTADRPEALQALAAAGDQLRKQLEDRGIDVLRLDINLSAEARGEARTGARQDGTD
ncbi:MAG: flagellar hook-length control protein FliK, partial [Solirubrobacteraceae bacterium]|nr:flagellar hook-length control protein FliK [Solirubrobacteraceae bacterium]